MLAGISLGSAIAVKWNGLGFALSLAVWELARCNRKKMLGAKAHFFSSVSSLAALVWVFAIASVTYFVVWLPHLWIAQENFSTLHSSLFSFHQRLSPAGHSACSKWFTWPLLIKPIAYWYEERSGLAYTVSNLGNPLVWWLSSAATLLIAVDKLASALSRRNGDGNALTSFLLVSYLANWLPWIFVKRCTFIYLYMPAAIFSFMLLAWIASGWLHDRTSWVRLIGWAMLVLIMMGFAFWLPLSIGSPLSAEALQLRWWLRSWI